MRFCPSCGATVSVRVPDDDNRERYVCDRCASVHYHNPRMVVGCLPVWQDRVLLCQRGIEPRRGFWTLPAGFLEMGESTLEGALRETREEACADVRVHGLYRLFDLPYISQLYLFYRGDLIDGRFDVGEETLAVDLFAEHEVPWDALAFPIIEKTLRAFFADRHEGHFPVRMEVLAQRL